MELLELLESKNRCLQRFLNDSESFLSSATDGNLTALDQLDSRRESIIKALALYDDRITSVVQLMPQSEKTTALKSSVQKTIETHDQLVQAILMADELIIKKIEAEKERLLKELSASDRQTQLVRKFKSKWISESGEKLDGEL